MTEHDPQPGELWWTDAGTLVWCEDGWHWTGGRRCENQDWIGRRLVGYTVEYVEKLRAERDQVAQLKAARKAVKPSTLDQLVAIRDKAMERAHHELDKFTELGLSSIDDATAAAHLGRAGVLYDLAGQLAGVITNIRQEQEK